MFWSFWLKMTSQQVTGRVGHRSSRAVHWRRQAACSDARLNSVLWQAHHRRHSLLSLSHIRAMRHIRPVLTLDVAKAMAVSIVGCRLDYCNSVLYGMSQANIDKLQRVQNILARVVVGAPCTIRYDTRWYFNVRSKADISQLNLAHGA